MTTETSIETSIPAVSTFLRDLNILLKSARMYGAQHTRTTFQSTKAWESLQAALAAGGKLPLQIAASQNRLFVNNAPLKTGPIETSFAQMLTAGDLASITFRPTVTAATFNEMIRIFSEAGSRPRGLAEKMRVALGSGPEAGIRIDEVRFVQAGPGGPGNEAMANLLAQSLGNSLGDAQVRLSQPAELLRLLAATDSAAARSADPRSGLSIPPLGTRREPGIESRSDLLNGIRYEPRNEIRTASRASALTDPRIEPRSEPEDEPRTEAGSEPELAEDEVTSVIRLLSRLAQKSAGDDTVDTGQVQEEFTGLSKQGRDNLRRIIADLSATEPGDKPMNPPLLLQVAQNLAIKLAIERYGNGDSRIDAVTEMLHRMNSEIETLRKAMGVDNPKENLEGAAKGAAAPEEGLKQEFWKRTTPKDRVNVLLSDEAWQVPTEHIRNYLEELTDRNDRSMLEKVLLNYVNCIHNPFPEARRAVANGLRDLATVLSSPVSHSLRFAIREVGEQLLPEEDPDLQNLLADTFTALGQEAVTCGRYKAAFQVLSALDSLENSNTELANRLRAKISLNPRIPDFIEEALRAPEVPEELTELLRYVSRVAVEHIASRLSRCTRRRERERLVNLAKALSPDAIVALRDGFRVRPPSTAVSVVALLSRLDPDSLEKLLPIRLPDWNRMYQDTVIRQISAASSQARGRLMAALILAVDPLLVPEVIDEIGLGMDQAQVPLLQSIAMGENPRMDSSFIRIKAMEGLGRLRAVSAVPFMRQVVSTIGADAQKYPREFRIAAAQSLRKTDPEGAPALLAAAGIGPDDLEPIPCDPTKDTPGSRQRYYPRVKLPRPQPAKIITAEGEFSTSVLDLNLGGGLCVTEKEFIAGTAAIVRVRVGVRAFAAKVILRNSRKDHIAYEIVDIDSEERGKLRSFLQGLRH